MLGWKITTPARSRSLLKAKCGCEPSTLHSQCNRRIHAIWDIEPRTGRVVWILCEGKVSDLGGSVIERVSGSQNHGAVCPLYVPLHDSPTPFLRTSSPSVQVHRRLDLNAPGPILDLDHVQRSVSLFSYTESSSSWLGFFWVQGFQQIILSFKSSLIKYLKSRLKSSSHFGKLFGSSRF